MKKVCEIPLRRIYENSLSLDQGEGGIIIERLKEINDNNIGFDARKK